MTQKTTLPTIESLTELTSFFEPPCLSLYQPTHRHTPGNQQDPIRFRNLVKELEASLKQKYPDVETRLLLKPFETLSHDQDFWNHTLDGLAVLGTHSLFRVFLLQRPVVELAIAADSFHTNPLRSFLQSAGRYQILGLSLHKIQLFEGNRDSLDEIQPAQGVPRTIDEAFLQTITELEDDDLTIPDSTVISSGDRNGKSTRHSSRKENDDVDSKAQRFFRAIDRAVFNHHSQPSNLPLILAALPEHHHLFHSVSHNPFLMKEGILVNPDVMSISELRKRAWDLLEPQYNASLTTLAEEFGFAKSIGLGSDDISDVAAAAAEGRVKTLMIESDRLIAGHLNSTTGLLEPYDPSNPRVDDKLDDLAELVGKMGGRVVVMPSEQMLGQTGLAATYRY